VKEGLSCDASKEQWAERPTVSKVRGNERCDRAPSSLSLHSTTTTARETWLFLFLFLVLVEVLTIATILRDGKLSPEEESLLHNSLFKTKWNNLRADNASFI
jgi:hypothetical protein